jgi:hypothetical protein
MPIYSSGIMTTAETSIPTPQTVEEGLAICEQLQQEAKDQGLQLCVRARRGRIDLARPNGMWTESPARLAMYFEGLSKICCGCHKVGTFIPFPKSRRRKRPVKK